MKRYGMLVALVGVGALATTRDAGACGGCFAPPGSVQVVTDHRMVLSLSPTQTILWDQLRYSGQPADFSWILPIRNGAGVRIELGDDQFVSVLDNLTAPVLEPPPRPYPPYCGVTEEDRQTPSAGAAAADAGTSVQVLQESVVGPYQTVTLHGDDPTALRTWLQTNGYNVPAPTQPVIDYYVGLHLDFVALRLRPGEGVSAMQPVRITSPGYNASLPLRMIAAGTANKVGLLLMVVASARIEAMNFPNGEVAQDSLTFDFDHPSDPTTDLRTAFDTLNHASGGRAWVTESAQQFQEQSIVQPLQFRGGGGADDVRLAFQGIGTGAVVTRMRADLAASALDADLSLGASDRPLRERTYQYGHVLHTPPPYPPCGSAVFGTPIDPTGHTTSACSAQPGGSSARSGGGLVLALGAAFAAVRRMRRRDRHSPKA